jgi:uncharacterized membrane protein
MFSSDLQLELTRPIWLVGLVALPILVLWFSRSLVDLPRRQMICSLVIRSVITLLLVLALAGLNLLKPTRELFVVFALDQSLSVDDDSRTAARQFITTATGHNRDHASRVLPFALHPEDFLARLPDAEIDSGNSPQNSPDGEPAASGRSRSEGAHTGALQPGTNLQAAIEVAAAGIPPHWVPRLVLLTDGNETLGDAHQTALAAGLRIFTVPLETRDDPEIQVSAVNVPAQVAQGEPFLVEVVVDSNHDDQVLVEIYSGEHKIISALKDVKQGENRFAFTEQVERPTEFAARISRPPIPADAAREAGVDGSAADAGTAPANGFQDTLLDNNMASGLVFAAGKPRVLLIESVPELARNLEWALDEEGILVDTRPPQGMPDSLADLQNYEVLMISNVPATALSARQMQVIRTYVSETGGGLIMLGGDESFGLGGYYKSVVEEVLPVRSDFEKEREKPSLGMVLVIDKSGSMGGQKIELAKDAARGAVELLGPRDFIGVIAFDGSPYWISEVRPASQKGLVSDRIASIEAGGGTTLYPAMEEAFDALMSTSAKLKHVIILTDGHSTPGDFEGIAQTMAAARITVSTVGVGDADQALLERIAEIGSGRYYFTDDPSSVPQIFAKETMAASKSAINEEPFIPQQIRSTPVLSDISFEEAPFLLGYVITRPKATSEVILVAESGDPLLVWWRYGLGMSVAFTSDAKSRWAAEWLTWNGYNKFWAQVIRHSMRKSESKGFLVDVARTGRTAKVRIDAVDPTGRYLNQADTELTLIDPRLKTSQVRIDQTGPGRYEADIDVADSGAYHLQITQKQNGQLLHQQSRGLVVGYPDELRLKPPNADLLQRIARATGGAYDPAPAAVFADNGEQASRATPLWPFLVMAAAMLFLADVALRRIDFSLVFGAGRHRARYRSSPRSV